MQRRFLAFLVGTLSLFTLITPSVSAQGSPFDTLAIWVCNRGDGNLSIINTAIDEIDRTVGIPAPLDESEPIDCVATPNQALMWVTDRAQSVLWIYQSQSYGNLGGFLVGNGAGHVHTDPNGKALWVVNESDRTMSVFRPRTFSSLGTVPMPNDLALAGGFPHDVYVDNNGEFAYVTIHGLPSGNDAVVKYGAQTGVEVDRVRLGDSPHVAFSRKKLFVPCEGSDLVYIVDAATMNIIDERFIPNPRGAAISPDKDRFYTSNVSGGGGVNAIWVIDVKTLAVIGGGTDAPSAVPNQLVVDDNNGRRVYCTHSGSGTTVSIYNSTAANPDPVLLKELTVGLNPTGLDYAF